MARGKRSRGRKSAKGWEEEHESRAELLMCPSATCTLFGAPVLPPEHSGEAAADTVIGSSDTVTGIKLQTVATLFMEDKVSPTLLAFKPVRPVQRRLATLSHSLLQSPPISQPVIGMREQCRWWCYGHCAHTRQVDPVAAVLRRCSLRLSAQPGSNGASR